MTRHLRTPAAIKLTREQAVSILDQTLTTARALDSRVALIRPQAFAAIMAADPHSLISWERGADFQYRPVYRGVTLEVSEQLYPVRTEKVIGALTRGMRAV